MSATPTMTGEEARTVLLQNVFVPAFFDKLAAHGIIPADDDEAMTYLGMGETLAEAETHEQVKAAAHSSSLVKQAAADLTHQFETRYGVAPPAAVAEPEAVRGYIAKQAEQLGADPAMQAAVEAYNAAVGQYA